MYACCVQEYYSSEVAFCIRSRSIVGKAVLALYTNTCASVMRFTSSSVCLTIPTVELDPGDLETWRPGGRSIISVDI